VLGEQFHVVPDFPNGDLKVSENWVQIKGTYIPKNFIVGTYDTSFYSNTPSLGLTFVLITGERHFRYVVPKGSRQHLYNCTVILQKVLPHAIIRDDSWLYSWFCMHKKDIKRYFAKQIKQKGVKYLIENQIDFFHRFTMDGKMKDELDEGLLVEVADKNGNVHTGHIQKVISRNNNKKGCLVMLEEGRVVGRVRKIYGNRKKYSTVNPNDKIVEHVEKEETNLGMKIFDIVFVVFFAIIAIPYLLSKVVIPLIRAFS
jgi:uncharacterized protein YwbE